MTDTPFANAASDAASLEDALGAQLAYQEARSRLRHALARQDEAAADHWGAVSLFVVDAWNACPASPHA